VSRKKKILISLALTPVVLALLFVLFIGPWPAYRDSDYGNQYYYQEAMAGIAERADQNDISKTPGRLQAGWAKRLITPGVGVPMGGYSGRGNEKKSKGVRDDLYVRAMAFSDGVDTAVLVGSDMLIIPPNLSGAVRNNVASQTDLNENQILFNASHTHCGPGGFMPGLASKLSGGEFDPGLVEFLVQGFTEAIVDAVETLEPAALASGSVDAPQLIRNRMRDGAPVDPELSFLLVRQNDGDACYIASYSAHPTIFGSDMLEFSAEYPGELMRHIEANTSHEAQYLGGAVGSMGPRAPEAPDASSRVVAMGQALGDLIMTNDDGLEFRDHVDVAAAGLPVGMPQFQVRPSEDHVQWRVSPFAARFLGLKREGWIHGVRVGDLFFVGMPFDFSGETSVQWKQWAEGEGLDLWTLSFCSTYCGYFSPDKYYLEAPLNYETGAMSWFGPNVEAYYTELFRALVSGLGVNGGEQ
jgi:neutral ceramidase